MHFDVVRVSWAGRKSPGFAEDDHTSITWVVMGDQSKEVILGGEPTRARRVQCVPGTRMTRIDHVKEAI